MKTEERFKSVNLSNLPLDTVDNLLCSAFEGGITYWVQGVAAVRAVGKESSYVHEVALQGGRVILRTIDDESHELDDKAIKRGLACMARVAPHHVGSIFRDEIDAQTGDVFVQCCIFGEVVYG